MQQNLAELKNLSLATQSELTPEEYLTALMQMQELLCRGVAEGQDVRRLDELVVYLEKTARDKGVERVPEFRKGIQALRQVNKEISILIAGKRGEDRVAKTLEYTSRPHYSYRNIYVTDGERETELDSIDQMRFYSCLDDRNGDGKTGLVNLFGGSQKARSVGY